MMFDFGALPPEINSGRMYAGPGSEPLMVAASAWDVLAVELGAAVSGYVSVIDEVTNGPWVGPASAAMVAAVSPYVGWLGDLAGQAEQTASQARVAAGAFETAFAMTVPPPVVAANRVLLMTLIATNFFGQNTAAIAATEAEYMQMWAQDAAAMYGYSAASAAAAQVPRLTAPPDTATPDGESGQFAAVTQAAATPAGEVAHHVAAAGSQLASLTSIPQTLQNLGSSVASSTHYFIWNTIEDFLKYGFPTPENNWAGLVPQNYYSVIKQTLQAYFGVGVGNFGWSMGQQLTFGAGGSTAGSAGAWYPTPQFATLSLGGGPPGSLGGGLPGGGAVAAGVSQAGRVGVLSVPPGWVTPATPVSSVSVASPALTGAEGIPAHPVAASTPAGNTLLNGIPPGAAGRRSAGYVNKYGFRYSVVARPPSAG